MEKNNRFTKTLMTILTAIMLAMSAGVVVADGTDPLDPSDGGADWDGDGLTNAEEQNAGTNFNNPDTREAPIVWNGPILVSDRLIVVSSEGAAVAISPYTGRVIGSEKMPDGVSVPPIAAGNSVYFLANNATLAAYR